MAAVTYPSYMASDEDILATVKLGRQYIGESLRFLREVLESGDLEDKAVPAVEWAIAVLGGQPQDGGAVVFTLLPGEQLGECFPSINVYPPGDVDPVVVSMSHVAEAINLAPWQLSAALDALLGDNPQITFINVVQHDITEEAISGLDLKQKGTHTDGE